MSIRDDLLDLSDSLDGLWEDVQDDDTIDRAVREDVIVELDDAQDSLARAARRLL